MRKWVELVAVASCTTHRQTLPDGERGVDSVDDVLDLKLFRNDAAFRIASMIAVDPGGNPLVKRCVWQQVTGKLLDRELIERHVLVKRFEHPVPPPPHISRPVRLIAIRVCVPGCVEPANRHPLGVAR